MRAAVRLLLFAAILLFIPVLVRENLRVAQDVERARRQHERTSQQMEKATMELRRVEDRLTRLTTSMGAVEDEVREQHRMVMPGETLVLIEQPGSRAGRR